MVDETAYEFHVVGVVGWDTEGGPRPVTDQKYVRVDDAVRYSPPAGAVAFVWEEWIVLDRLEKFGRNAEL